MDTKMSFKEKRNFDLSCFAKPKAVGYFSLFDQDRKYCSEAKNLRYYCYRGNKCDFDLNEGFEDHIRKTKMKENEIKLDSLLQWINKENMLLKLLKSENQVIQNNFNENKLNIRPN